MGTGCSGLPCSSRMPGWWSPHESHCWRVYGACCCGAVTAGFLTPNWYPKNVPASLRKRLLQGLAEMIQVGATAPALLPELGPGVGGWRGRGPLRACVSALQRTGIQVSRTGSSQLKDALRLPVVAGFLQERQQQTGRNGPAAEHDVLLQRARAVEAQLRAVSKRPVSIQRQKSKESRTSGSPSLSAAMACQACVLAPVGMPRSLRFQPRCFLSVRTAACSSKCLQCGSRSKLR